MTEDRYDRQKDIIPADRLKEMTLTVVGVGAIGRQVALQLTAIGAKNLIFIDPDKVEITNLSSQGYREDELHLYKVTATDCDCTEINKEVKIERYAAKFDASKQEIGSILFCCVDNMESRREIWEFAKMGCVFFCDARTAAEVLRMLTVCDVKSGDHYPTTLFDEDQAYNDRCTAKTTIYTANIAAGFMVAQFAKYLRGIPIDHDFSFNLLTNGMNIVK